MKADGGLRFASRPIRLGVGPTIRTKHNSLGLDLFSEEAEGLESCETVGKQVPSGGWAMELARLGPRVCQSDETKKVSTEDDRVVEEAKCARLPSNWWHDQPPLHRHWIDSPVRTWQRALREGIALCPQPEPGHAYLDATARAALPRQHCNNRAAVPDA